MTVSLPAVVPAGQELAETHLDLVARTVTEFIGRVPAHVRRSDLESAARLALVQAARAFDPTRGVPFGAFAQVRLRGAILDEMRSQDWASRSVRVRGKRVQEATDRLTGALGREPSEHELAADLDLPLPALRAALDDLHRASLLSLQGFADPTTVDELLPHGSDDPETELLRREELGYLRDAVAVLPHRLRRVVESYFLEELPMAVVADELGVSESRISQMRGEALLLLRDGLLSALDRDRLTEPARPEGCVARRREEYFEALAGHRAFRDRLVG